MQDQDHNSRTSSFPGSQLQLPRRQLLRRPHPSLAGNSNNILDSDSHIHVSDSNFSCTPVSQSDMSTCSRPDSSMEDMSRRAPLTPDMRQTNSFEDWRMPAFSSLNSVPDILRDDDLRDLQSTRATTQSSQRPQRSSHSSNTLSLGGGCPGEDFQAIAATANTRGSHRRGKNKALGSNQFDDILTAVFYQ